jgi:TM2 domain-containing membrane protein YozV
MWMSGRLTSKTLFTAEGQKEWMPLATVATILDAPPETPKQASGDRLVTVRKSRGVYIVLGLIFGCFGFHNFYAGRNGCGVIQLIVTMTLGWFLIGIVITALWALMEVLIVDQDGAGNKMA